MSKHAIVAGEPAELTLVGIERHSLDSGAADQTRPDGVIPFAIDEDAARGSFTSWVSTRRFAPRKLREGDCEVREIEGVFLPLWSFSANTVSEYAGKRGERRTRWITKTTTDANGNTQTNSEAEQYTDWYRASGVVSRSFDAVPVLACTRPFEKLPPWMLERCVRHETAYTEGKRVVAPEIGLDSALTMAKAVMYDEIELDVRADIGGDEQSVKDVATNYGTPAYALLLLPAWLVTYRHNGHDFPAVVNGSTGEVAGDRPHSPMKITALLAAAAVVVAAVILLVHGR